MTIGNKINIGRIFAIDFKAMPKGTNNQLGSYSGSFGLPTFSIFIFGNLRVHLRPYDTAFNSDV